MMSVTVTFASQDARRYATRVLSSHVTLADVIDWARMQCGDEEVVAEITLSAAETLDDRPDVRLAGQRVLNPLSRRLFH